MEKETSDKLCENCGAKLKGPYCHACGQKHLEHKHSFITLLVHFVSDFVHFDAQLFTTLKPLFRKPGLVAKDYVEGRRKRHLDPIRMYVFLSIVFFALFFYVSKIDRWQDPESRTSKEELLNDQHAIDNDSLFTDSLKEITNKAIDVDSILAKVEEVRQISDSTIIVADQELFKLLRDSVEQSTDTAGIYKGFKERIGDSTSNIIKISSWEFPNNQDEYLADQKAFPKSERDGWIKKNLILKIIHLNDSAREDEQAFWLKLLYQFVKSLPKLLFILLPFFALILKLLYIRRNLYYVDHLIFMIYFFCFIYIVYSIAFLIQLSFGFSLISLLFFWVFFYLYFAMRRFYEQSRFKTVAKFFIFGFLSTIVAVFGALIGALVSAFFI